MDIKQLNVLEHKQLWVWPLNDTENASTYLYNKHIN